MRARPKRALAQKDQNGARKASWNWGEALVGGCNSLLFKDLQKLLSQNRLEPPKFVETAVTVRARSVRPSNCQSVWTQRGARTAKYPSANILTRGNWHYSFGGLRIGSGELTLRASNKLGRHP